MAGCQERVVWTWQVKSSGGLYMVGKSGGAMRLDLSWFVCRKYYGGEKRGIVHVRACIRKRKYVVCTCHGVLVKSSQQLLQRDP